jgi:Tol biopolymer transport system component
MKLRIILISISILLFSVVGTNCSSPSPVAIITPVVIFSQKIAFQSNREGNWEIYVINADGSNPLNITNNKADDDSPTWSPDGQKIAFHSNRDGNWEIYVMNADGSDLTQITNYPMYGWTPTWSPDGQKIAFESNFDGNWEIYVMNADGTNLINITNNKADDDSPAWSPDGQKIAFQSNRDRNKEIFVMNSDGSNPINITNSSADDGSPAWSPDGQKIAFSSNLDRDGNFAIYVQNIDSIYPARLTDSPKDDGSPTWSSDGQKIAFQSWRDLNWEIYVMNADGSNPINISNSSADDGSPAWLPEFVSANSKIQLSTLTSSATTSPNAIPDLYNEICLDNIVTSPNIGTSIIKKLFNCSEVQNDEFIKANLLAVDPSQIWYAIDYQYAGTSDITCTGRDPNTGNDFSYTYRGQWEDIYSLRDVHTGIVISSKTFLSTLPKCVFTDCTLNRLTYTAVCLGGQGHSTYDQSELIQWLKDQIK